jgi:hypothetical protein
MTTDKQNKAEINSPGENSPVDPAVEIITASAVMEISSTGEYPLSLTDPVLTTDSSGNTVFSFRGKPVVRGKQNKPIKVFLYGKNGIGKSSFMAQMDAPIFLDLEGNIGHLPVDSQPLGSLRDISEFLQALSMQEHPYKTLVLDSVDVLESLCFQYVKVKYKDDLGYGKEYVHVADCFRKILTQLEPLFNHKRMNIAFIGHETIRRVELPTEKAFDRHEPRIREKFWGILCDWVNCVLFATNKIIREATEEAGFGRKRDDRIRARSDHVLYTTPSAAYVAKNVFGLDREMPLDFSAFMSKVTAFQQQ